VATFPTDPPTRFLVRFGILISPYLQFNKAILMAQVFRPKTKPDCLNFRFLPSFAAHMFDGHSAESIIVVIA
jgi:hypothetical protein